MYIDFSNVHSIESIMNITDILCDLLRIQQEDNAKCISDIVAIVQKIYNAIKSIKIEPAKFKYILSGKLHGNVLFYDIEELGKYAEKIHPAVGDIVTIDFPDESNRERYEITECFDKQLTQDGISPLLHKYVWKCKARRYVNSYEEITPNEADDRLQEKIDY